MKKPAPKRENSKNLVWIIALFIFLALTLSLLTNYLGSSDIGDYVDTAKFFAGDFQAKLRSSHSVLYGLMSSPLLMVFNSFILMKVESIFWLFLLILSIYYLSNKNKKTLLLLLASPIVWYMTPWATPAFLTSLLLLWAYYFIEKFDKQEKIKYLIYSGLFAGLASAIWTTSLFFTAFLLIFYLYDKKLYFSLIFIASIFIGFLPTLIVDQILFNFAFYSLSKHFFSCVSYFLYGGAYSLIKTSKFLNYIFLLFFIPFYLFLFFKKSNFSGHRKAVFFLSFSFLFILLNPQIRMLIALVPISLLLLGDMLNEKQFKIQLILFLIISLLVINPYVLQIKYQLTIENNKSLPAGMEDGLEIKNFILNFKNINLDSIFNEDLLKEDLNLISKDFPNQTFIVDGNMDYYQALAHIYWGKDIKEFVSIQDYDLWLNNETAIADKIICSFSKIPARRDICMSIELRKLIGDKTNYDSIVYLISPNESQALQNFKLIKKYALISVFEKID